jgi:hypothetical protein
MSLRTISSYLLIVACLALLAIPVQAEGDSTPSVKVIYQTPFSSDPRWVTNSPSYDYWDPSTGRYHFSLEPSTGNYAYTTIPSMDGPFTFEYDVTLDRVDEGASFRFGVTGAEMDFNKGPNVISMFSNGKHENIMSLHVVTTGAKQMEVNSQSDDELTSGTIAYKGPTVNFELNKTYHVTVDYDEAAMMLAMRVEEKESGRAVWSYFIKTVERIRGMNRIYLGSRGDYGGMNVQARGYIDNVRLTQPGLDIVTEQTSGSLTEATTAPPVTTKKTLVIPTPYPTGTPQSPMSALPVILAISLIGTLCVLRGTKKF